MEELYRTHSKGAAPFLASKWLHIQFLLEISEMRELIETLDPLFLFSTLGVKPIGENVISKEHFLASYESYLDLFKSGVPISETQFQFCFTALLTSSLATVQAIDLPHGNEIIRPRLPSLQMQHHCFDYSPMDKKFRSMIFGDKAISWGLQLSYPQLFQDPRTRVVTSCLDAQTFCNAALFRTFQKWIRENTLPTPFLIEGKIVRAPIRLGKKCLDWIESCQKHLQM